MLARIRADAQHAGALNAAMQPLLRAWGERNAAAGAEPAPRHPGPGAPPMLDQHDLPWFRELNRALSEPLDDDAFAARIASNVTRMDALATELLQLARTAHPGIDSPDLRAALDGRPAGTSAPCVPEQWRKQLLSH